MSTVLIANRSHPSYRAIAAAVDQAGPLSEPPSIAADDRVVVLLGYDDVGSVEARLGAIEIPRGAKVLLVHPDYGERTPLAEACQRAAERLRVCAILQHAPATELVLHCAAGVRSNAVLSLSLPGAVPLVAWSDVARSVIRWLSSGGPERIALHGPRACDGAELAAALSTVLADTLDPRVFARLRMREMDRDGDGVLEAREVVRFLVALGVPTIEAQRAVAVADADGDGTIDVEEFTAGLESLLETALRDLPRTIGFDQMPPAMLRQYWVQAGRPFRQVAAESDHLVQTASLGGEATWTGAVEPIDVMRRHALRFINLFILPGRGVLSVHNASFGDPVHHALRWWELSDELLARPAVLSRLRTTDGHELHTRKARDGSAFEASWVVEGPTETICFGEGDQQRALALHEDHVVGVACRGVWSGLRSAMADLLQRRRLRPWERALFRELGALRISQAREIAEPDEIICSCANVSRRTLQARIKGGCRTLSQIVAETGATSICGGCTPVVEELLGSPRLQVADVLARHREGSDHIRMSLAPVQGPPSPSRAGQHVVIQGRIQGRWVTRAYTLISPAGRPVPYEIMVKRDELGLFSRWLADVADEEALFRVSEPTGGFTLHDEDAGPIYMFAGGIGITPGIALARTLAEDPAERTLHIDWSARHLEDFVLERELGGLAEAHARLGWTKRCTSRHGRLDAATVARDYPFVEGAVAFLCGPGDYIDAVQAHLRSAGWPGEAIRTEQFSSNVTDAGEVKPDPRRRKGVVHSGGVTVIQHDSFFLDRARRWPLLREAEAFLRQMYRDQGLESVLEARLKEVGEEVERTGVYTHTTDELVYGSRLAWRNASRCVGRFFWSHLQVRDMRHLKTEREVFESLVDHIRLATNDGDILSTITIFRPGDPQIRVWNSQLIRYAGYRQADGRFIGDPANAALTEQAQALGWKGEGTPFDILPVIVQIGDAAPRWFELPREDCLEVPLEHPSLPWFAELGLRWYAVPAVAEMALDLGGIHYRCAPFNGFYMGTEIGARNFSDVDRYDMLPAIAERMGLDRSHTSTLWRDRALVELNIAVLHSFRSRKVRMQDHHAMARYFAQFEAQEQAAGRPVYGDWSWLVPPLSGSASPLFFRDDLRNVVLKPMYAYQGCPWQGEEPSPDHEGPVPPCPFTGTGGHG